MRIAYLSALVVLLLAGCSASRARAPGDLLPNDGSAWNHNYVIIHPNTPHVVEPSDRQVVYPDCGQCSQPQVPSQPVQPVPCPRGPNRVNTNGARRMGPHPDEGLEPTPARLLLTRAEPPAWIEAEGVCEGDDCGFSFDAEEYDPNDVPPPAYPLEQRDGYGIGEPPAGPATIPTPFALAALGVMLLAGMFLGGRGRLLLLLGGVCVLCAGCQSSALLDINKPATEEYVRAEGLAMKDRVDGQIEQVQASITQQVDAAIQAQVTGDIAAAKADIAKIREETTGAIGKVRSTADAASSAAQAANNNGGLGKWWAALSLLEQLLVSLGGLGTAGAAGVAGVRLLRGAPLKSGSGRRKLASSTIAEAVHARDLEGARLAAEKAATPSA